MQIEKLKNVKKGIFDGYRHEMRRCFKQERQHGVYPSCLSSIFFKKGEVSQNSEVPATPLAKALNYALNQKDALEKFLRDPRLNIDNNPAENVIRSIALGRKNWLFAGSKGGGKDLAILASFSATCHRNNVNFRR